MDNTGQGSAKTRTERGGVLPSYGITRKDFETHDRPLVPAAGPTWNRTTCWLDTVIWLCIKLRAWRRYCDRLDREKALLGNLQDGGLGVMAMATYMMMEVDFSKLPQEALDAWRDTLQNIAVDLWEWGDKWKYYTAIPTWEGMLEGLPSATFLISQVTRCDGNGSCGALVVAKTLKQKNSLAGNSEGAAKRAKAAASSTGLPALGTWLSAIFDWEYTDGRCKRATCEGHLVACKALASDAPPMLLVSMPEEQVRLSKEEKASNRVQFRYYDVGGNRRDVTYRVRAVIHTSMSHVTGFYFDGDGVDTALKYDGMTANAECRVAGRRVSAALDKTGGLVLEKVW